MELPLFQVNAFARDFRSGNPAGVCPLREWLPDTLMQAIAAENGFSETAFLVPANGAYELRWFTPACEVDLCGHATLAAAHVLRHLLGGVAGPLRFHTRSGELVVEAEGDDLVLDMPRLGFEAATVPEAIRRGLGAGVLVCYRGQDYMVVLESAALVQALRPDFAVLQGVDARGVIVTASGQGEVDFVSRWFGSAGVGVEEDPVTGSAHAMLVPYWAEVLGKTRLQARQLSARGGELRCELAGDRVRVAGRTVLYFQGVIRV